jgi:formate hydrogenlyase subunit 4
LGPSADLIAIVALLASARFVLALAGLDIGTSFGGIGASREVMFASVAEPAMLMLILSLALVAGSTQLSAIAAFLQSPSVGLRISLGLALVGLTLVAIPWGMTHSGADAARFAVALGGYVAKLLGCAVLLGAFEITVAKMRVFRAPQFIGAALMLGLLAALLRLVSKSY